MTLCGTNSYNFFSLLSKQFFRINQDQEDEGDSSSSSSSSWSWVVSSTRSGIFANKKYNFTLQTKSIVQKFQLQILELRNESWFQTSAELKGFILNSLQSIIILYQFTLRFHSFTGNESQIKDLFELVS